MEFTAGSARRFLLLLAVGFSIAHAPEARSHELRLFHPAPQSVASYRAYFGPSSRSYEQTVDLGAASASGGGVFTLKFPSHLQGEDPIFLALTAVGPSPYSLESALSNEIIIPPRNFDSDDDGVPDDDDESGLAGDRPCTGGEIGRCDDNCPFAPNGPLLGSCVGRADSAGLWCTSSAECGGAPGWCSMRQEDSDGDGIGDACDSWDNSNPPPPANPPPTTSPPSSGRPAAGRPLSTRPSETRSPWTGPTPEPAPTPGSPPAVRPPDDPPPPPTTPSRTRSLRVPSSDHRDRTTRR